MKMTEKLYYHDFYITETIAKVIEIDLEKGIVFDKTIAFPEGGGQEGDQGILIPLDCPNIEILFTDTQKGHGTNIYLDKFPAIQVNTPIYHKIGEEYYKHFQENKEFLIKINIERRAMLTLNHSGIHAVLMGIETVRPNFANAVFGAHISIERARLDFITDIKFTQEELKVVKEYVDSLLKNDSKIKSYQHPNEKEAWYWECENKIYPCGGTHLDSLGYIGEVKLKRKNLGKNSERIIAEFINYRLPIELYKKETLANYININS